MQTPDVQMQRFANQFSEHNPGVFLRPDDLYSEKKATLSRRINAVVAEMNRRLAVGERILRVKRDILDVVQGRLYESGWRSFALHPGQHHKPRDGSTWIKVDRDYCILYVGATSAEVGALKEENQG